MKKAIISAAIILIVVFTGCNSTKQIVIPLNSSVELDETYTIIWNGIGHGYRYENGQWERDEKFDYQFNVVQRRYENLWQSVKTMQRLHPEFPDMKRYGGRYQTLYFEIDYRKEGTGIVSDLRSSIGNGNGTTDLEFRNQVLDFELTDISKWSPYSHFRITQNYRYEEGVLEETVLLYKVKDGIEVPYFKNEEKAYIYNRNTLSGAPTIYIE